MLITVEEALKCISERVEVLPVIEVSVSDGLGCVLAKDVHSPINMPPFQQSAMDGYAIHFNGQSRFNLVGEIKAGDDFEPRLEPGQAVRIFTGAPVPPSAHAVVRQEDTSVEDTMLIVDPLPKSHANIRPLGEQIQAGQLALQKGLEINAGSIGYLSTLGITHISVFKQPKVAILVTGNELIQPGQPLGYGQIYESNAQMLKAALNKYGIRDVSVHRVLDEFEATKAQLHDMLKASDVVLCSGGISVGDYDFVGKALIDLDVEEVFYKVKQKPGKPLFFGKKDETLVFALPGNPAAALTCFYVYVCKALNIQQQKSSQGLQRMTKHLTDDFTRKGDRAQFLKASACGDEIKILEGQSSAMLHTYALSNALVYLPLEKSEYKKGDPVECLFIDQ